MLLFVSEMMELLFVIVLIFKFGRCSVVYWSYPSLPPPHVRAHNLLLGGLWFGRSFPRQDVFLLPFARHCKQLSAEGFKIKVKDGELIKELCMKAHLLCCCADAPATIQCIHGHGGGFSCHWCLHPSENRRFDILDYTPEKRTRAEIIADGSAVTALDHQNASVNGVTGVSPLLLVPTFDIIDGMILEYFHAAAHGIAKTLFGAWLGDDGCEKEIPYYIGQPDNIDQMNKLIRSIRHPVEARRCARELDDFADWKGREFENFVLYHSVPILAKILPANYLKHWCLFVQAMHLLLQDEVTEANLTQASILLRDFGTMIPDLYPERHLTYNMHIVTMHLAENCRRWGQRGA